LFFSCFLKNFKKINKIFGIFFSPHAELIEEESFLLEAGARLE